MSLKYESSPQQFMESVETVLETYGGPEEDWKDTYGVPRTLEEFELNQVQGHLINRPPYRAAIGP